jgi:hypothetical protein
MSVVAHECWHAIKRIMDYRGMEPEEEFIAYHLEYLIERFEAGHKKAARRKKGG